MKIVVTGALGHIGSRLIRELPAAYPEAEIVMLDNLSSQRYCSLFNLPPGGKYRFIEADVLNADLPAIFQGAQVVVHLAAITNAEDSLQNKDMVEQVNFLGAQRVANACLATGSAMILTSTTSVYGSQAQTVDENCPISDLKPQSPYADSKLKAEQFLQMLGETKGLRFVTCRLGTIFGTSIGMRFHTAVNKFCWQAVMGQTLTVWRTALNQNRPYLDLGDAVEAINFIVQMDLYDRRIHNVVTCNTSVGRIVEMISSHVPGVAVEYVDSAIMNQLSYEVSSARFRSTGFCFSGDLQRGIQQTIDLLRAKC